MEDSQPSPPRNLDHAGNSTTTIPLDLTFEILSRLPLKSISHPIVYYIRSRPVNGFVCCTRGSSIAVCNPATRQIVKLPDVESNKRNVYARLGYDPVQDQYKVLCVIMFDGFSSHRRDIEQEHFVFTLSSRQKEWRKIEIPQGVTYDTVYGGICIDGAIYYGVGRSGIVRLDVRSEKLELFQAPENSHITTTYDSTLLNYNGKLGGIEYDYSDVMILWILEDAEKQEWSEMRCAALPSECYDLLEYYVRSKGEIHTGELMLINPRLKSSKPFSVCYYDFNRESIRRVEVEGLRMMNLDVFMGLVSELVRCCVFPGYVENI